MLHCHPFFFHVRGMTLCPDFPVALFPMALAQSLTVCARCVSSSNVRQVTIGRPWDFPCIHSSY